MKMTIEGNRITIEADKETIRHLKDNIERLVENKGYKVNVNGSIPDKNVIGEIKFCLSPALGTRMVTKEVFEQLVKSGHYTDEKGYGHPSNGDRMCKDKILPSDLNAPDFQYPDGTTHIVWFKRDS